MDAFTVTLRAEQKKPLADQYLPVFVAVADNGDTLRIFPLEGKGLWGPIWGYVSLKEDLSTIAGVTFDHKGETPGLGAEINTTPFESQFSPTRISLKTVHSSLSRWLRVAPGGNLHEVDAISVAQLQAGT